MQLVNGTIEVEASGVRRTNPPLTDSTFNRGESIMVSRTVSKSTCVIEGCSRRTTARELCNKHYMRFLRHGDPSEAQTDWGSGETVEEKFYSRLRPSLTNSYDGTNCVEWQASGDARGYGFVRVDGKRYRTHRYAWMLANGREPELQILHKCDNPPCCNPMHLYEGTDADNYRDRVERGLQRWRDVF